MVGRKWYPCNVPVLLLTTVERVISFKNPISRESARRKIRALNANLIRSFFVDDFYRYADEESRFELYAFLRRFKLTAREKLQSNNSDCEIFTRLNSLSHGV